MQECPSPSSPPLKSLLTQTITVAVLSLAVSLGWYTYERKFAIFLWGLLQTLDAASLRLEKPCCQLLLYSPLSGAFSALLVELASQQTSWVLTESFKTWEMSSNNKEKSPSPVQPLLWLSQFSMAGQWAWNMEDIPLTCQENKAGDPRRDKEWQAF